MSHFMYIVSDGADARHRLMRSVALVFFVFAVVSLLSTMSSLVGFIAENSAERTARGGRVQAEFTNPPDASAIEIADAVLVTSQPSSSRAASRLLPSAEVVQVNY